MNKLTSAIVRGISLFLLFVCVSTISFAESETAKSIALSKKYCDELHNILSLPPTAEEASVIATAISKPDASEAELSALKTLIQNYPMLMLASKSNASLAKSTNSDLNAINQVSGTITLLFSTSGSFADIAQTMALVKPGEAEKVSVFVKYLPSVLALGAMALTSSGSSQKTTDIVNSASALTVSYGNNLVNSRDNKQFARISDVTQRIAIQSLIVPELLLSAKTMEEIANNARVLRDETNPERNPNPTPEQMIEYHSRLQQLLGATGDFYSIRMPALKKVIDGNINSFNGEALTNLKKVSEGINQACSDYREFRPVAAKSQSVMKLYELSISMLGPEYSNKSLLTEQK